ncbi:MAG: fatty acid desaturase [Chitinophagales bacterium]
MKASFHESTNLSQTTLRSLVERKNNLATLRFVLLCFAFVLVNMAVVWAWNEAWYFFVLAQLAYSIVVCSIFAALHETGHGTAFKSRGANKIAAFLAGFAHVYPPSLFRALHFTHHKYTHIPGKDPEISLGNRPAPSILVNPGMYLSWLTGFPLFFFKVMMVVAGAIGMPEFLRKNLYPFVQPQKRWAVFRESALFLLIYVAIIYFAVTTIPSLWGIFVGQIVGHCLLAFYVSMEHNGLDHEGSIFDKTRSMKTNKLVKLVMWNMPYHAEHHAYPAVPFHALPELHEHLKPELKHHEKSHLDFHLESWTKLIKK